MMMVLSEDDTKTVRVSGRTYKLPTLLRYRQGMYGWVPLHFGEVKKGDTYVSGAVPEIYTAPADLTQQYLVVTVMGKFKQVHAWAPAHAVDDFHRRENT